MIVFASENLDVQKIQKFEISNFISLDHFPMNSKLNKYNWLLNVFQF